MRGARLTGHMLYKGIQSFRLDRTRELCVMISISLPSALQGSALLVVLFLLARLLLRKPAAPLPPGPNPIPLLGNLTIPEPFHVPFKRWADEYGDVMLYRIMGLPILFVNTRKAAAELLEKRTASTGGRPHQVMCDDLCHLSPDPSRTNDLALHRQYRRLYNIVIGPRTAACAWPIQVRETRRAALEILESPSRRMEPIRRAIAAIVFELVYGMKIKSYSDPMVQMANEALQRFETIVKPGNWLVDMIPALQYLPKWLPGTDFLRLSKEYDALNISMRTLPYEQVKREMAKGTAKPCLTVTLMEEEEKYGEELIKWITISHYTGGAETSASALHTFFAAMVLYPSVQAKAQAELDTIIGREHPPTLEDRERLPYCTALVSEVLRWQPVAPVALPHCMLKDEIYEGYLLPKGTTIMANVWAMTRDERDFPDADEFQPERWLTEDGTLKEDVPGRTISLAFGFGRRICPGWHLAEANLFAGTVAILWSAVLSKPEGVKIEWVEGLGPQHPKDFKMEVRPRWDGAVEALRASLGE
ncbi:cytochrome P450 [Calocera cornea HHB12733]|uniref:Cytochrome P450 n=1 Tax=Calocera cornea HHB12733 TaxID=1353952 RepID=A0A165GU22_9BASI|nr:cytochrome P450 [Calocera cornea HHB12733]